MPRPKVRDEVLDSAFRISLSQWRPEASLAARVLAEVERLPAPARASPSPRFWAGGAFAILLVAACLALGPGWWNRIALARAAPPPTATLALGEPFRAGPFGMPRRLPALNNVTVEPGRTPDAPILVVDAFPQETPE